MLVREITPVKEIQIRCIKVFTKEVKGGINNELQNQFKEYAEKINRATAEILSENDGSTMSLSDAQEKAFERTGPLKLPFEASKKALNQKIMDLYEAIYDQCYESSKKCLTSSSQETPRYYYPIKDKTSCNYFCSRNLKNRENKYPFYEMEPGKGIYDARGNITKELNTCSDLYFRKIHLPKFDLQWFNAPAMISLSFVKCDIFQMPNAWEIFEDNISKLSNLHILEIGECEITEIPSTLFSKFPSKMESLNFEKNNLKEIPSEISNVKNLKCLNVNGNPSLSNVNFPWMSLPKSMVAIFLKETNVTTLPLNIGQHLINLEMVEIQLQNDINVEDLAMDGLSITEMHPTERRGFVEKKDKYTTFKMNISNKLKNKSKYHKLTIWHSSLTSHPWETLSPRLTELNFAYNFLESICSLKHLINLQYLLMSNNRISKVEWESLPESLEEIDLTHNLLTTVGSLDHLKMLKIFSINYNQMTHINWKSLPGSLEKLEASYNSLSEIGDIKHLLQLQEMNLENNKLIAVQWESLPQHLETLNLSNNLLTSVESICHIKNLKTLELQNNKICSVKWFLLPENLEEINISTNSLNGLASIKHLLKLQKLELQLNEISFVDWENLPESLSSELNLSYNCITVVNSIQHLKNLANLKLQHNKISSVVWEKLPEMLRSLLLSHNLISTVDPLNKLQELEKLELQHNQITSVIWESLSEGIVILNLSNNLIELVGSLKHLNDLENLDLHNNKLTYFGGNFNDVQRLAKLNLSNNHIVFLEKGFEFLHGLYDSLRLNLSNNNFNYNNGHLIENLWKRIPNTYSLILNDNNLMVIPCQMLNKFTFLVVMNCNLEYICPQIYSFTNDIIKINVAQNPKFKLSFIPKQFFPSTSTVKKPLIGGSHSRIVTSEFNEIADTSMEMQALPNNKKLTKYEKTLKIIEPKNLNPDIRFCQCCAMCEMQSENIEMVERVMVMDLEFLDVNPEEAKSEYWSDDFNFFTSKSKWIPGQWKTNTRTQVCGTCKKILQECLEQVYKSEKSEETKVIKKSRTMVAASDDFTTTEDNSEDTSNVNKIPLVQKFSEYYYDEPHGSSSKLLPSIRLSAYNMELSYAKNFYGNVSNDNHFEVMPNMTEPYFDEQAYQQELCQNSQYSNELNLFNPQNNTDVGEQLCTTSKNSGQRSFEFLNEYQTFAPKSYADFEQNVNNQHELVWVEYSENKTFPPQHFYHNWIYNIPTEQFIINCCNALPHFPFNYYSLQYVYENNLYGYSICGLTKLLTKYVKADQHAGFRSLAWLLSGNEELYEVLRHHIRSHISSGNLPAEFYNAFPNINNYDLSLQESDIYAAANFFQLNILVFTNEGDVQWILYSDSGFNENQPSIILSNPKHLGYNPVVAAEFVN